MHCNKPRIVSPFAASCLLVFCGTMAPAYVAHAGVTLYVSSMGDNSDGSSWEKSFTTVQAALDAVPDEKGGHRVLIRPGTYMEANLHPAFKGAPGNYNTLEVDFDGSQGSGRSGYAVLDASDAKLGLKSVDWWSNFRESPEFSGVDWDRWNLRHIYATGGDAGLFWDLPPKIEQFTVVVEDSVGIGRAFGGGVGHILPRVDEPIVFRRCTLWSQDWWGDAAGAYVRAENESMQETPDVTFEDCTLVGPDNALQAGNPTYSGFTRVKLKGCRLVSLNYSQPRGTPGSGIIISTIEGRFLHVDLEDCTLMGYKVFGAGEGEVSYSTKGSVRAYVQFEQDMPKGIHRIGYWPTEVFASIVPPAAPQYGPVLRKESLVRTEMCEVTPVEWNGRLCIMDCVRPASGGESTEYYLCLRDAETSEELARFAEGYGLACAFVSDGIFYAFASRHEKNDWNDVTVFYSKDLKTWESKVVITQEKEHLFNSSVCADADGFVMAYESNDGQYPAFTTKFARSKDLLNWEKIPDAILGRDRYTACPCIRFVDGMYYVVYTEHREPRWFFEAWLARSPDLRAWTLSPSNPLLTADADDECINNSDVDIIERDGKTYIYYTISDQLTWANVKRATYDGSLKDLFASAFAAGAAPASR